MNPQTSGEGARLSWYWLLLPVLLAYYTPVLDGFAVSLQYFIIPAAALLGARFGLTGVIAVAVGGLAFVVSVRGGAWGGFGGQSSLYLVALAVSALAATRYDGSVVWPRWPRSDAARTALMLGAPFLLLLYLFMGQEQSVQGGQARVAFSFVPHVLAYFLIFMLAARGAKLWHLVAGMTLAAALSWLLAYGGVFPSARSNIQLDLLPLQPVAMITALAYFSAGACFRRAADRPEPCGWWRRPYLLAALLLVVWIGAIQPLSWIRLEWSRIGLSLLDSPALLPLVGFMLGALRGVTGAWVAAAMTATLLIAASFGRVAEFQWFSVWAVPLEAPFVAFAFGWLGAALVHAQLAGASVKWRRRRAVVTAWLLAAGTALTVAGSGSPLRITLAVAFAALFCAAFFLGRRLVRRGSGSGLEVSDEGWVTFLTVLCVLLLAALNWREVAVEVANWGLAIAAPFVLLYGILHDALSGGAAVRRPAEGFALAEPVFMLLALAFAFSMLRKAWKDVRKVWRDLRALWRYARLARTG